MAVGLAIGHGLTPEQLDLAEWVEAVALEQLRPLEEAAATDELHPGVLEVVRASGILRHFVPQEHGGAGLSVTGVALIRERLAYHCIAADEFYASQGLAIQPIVLHGSEEQRDRHVAALLDGGRTFAFCLTEPGAGSDVRGLRLQAARVDGGFVLDGHKRYAFAGNVADTLLVFGRIVDDAQPGKLTAFIVERPVDGISATALPLLSPGPEWELDFDGCGVDSGSVLGEEGAGIRIALGNLDRLRPTVGAAALGMAQRALDEAVDHVTRRQAFGQALGDFQGVRFGLAQAAAELDAARSLVYGAARHADSAAADVAVAGSSAKAKLVATETAQRVIDTALQYHGGVGLIRGGVIERCYRAVRATRIYEGASEIMRLVIARELLAGSQGRP